MKKFILKRIKKKYKNIIIPTGVTVLTAGRLFYYSFDKSDDNDWELPRFPPWANNDSWFLNPIFVGLFAYNLILVYLELKKAEMDWTHW